MPTAFSQAMPKPLPRHVSCGLTLRPDSEANTAAGAPANPWDTAAVMVWATVAGTQGCATSAVKMLWTAGAEAGATPVRQHHDFE